MSAFDSDLFKLTNEGRIYTVTMCNDDNRITRRFLDEFDRILDHLDSVKGSFVLVVTSSHPKIFCNGFEVEELVADAEYMTGRLGLLGHRIMTASYATIGMINGHAFAGGAFLAISFDYRIMRSDRGFICFNEIDLGMPIPQPFQDLLLPSRVPVSVIHEFTALGMRFTGSEAVTRGIAQKAVPNEQLKATVDELATKLSKKFLSRAMLKETRLLIHREQVKHVEEWVNKTSKKNTAKM
mmetsp:Transcript_2016/g.2109  ORF Transcript_2016/g.2109 Transcript_2016/m.2109 type:complete len:239 (-) Transcript_2016:81-797(-)